MFRIVVCLFLSLFLSFVSCGLSSHQYEDGEEVTLFVNRVGPHRNPQETYSYHSLPFCANPKHIESKSEGLGEALLGYELVKGPFLIQFKQQVKPTVTCSKVLTDKNAHDLAFAIKNHYWYQYFLDDLPMWGMVGEIQYQGEVHYPVYKIFTHQKFEISYNGNQIIHVNLTARDSKNFAFGGTIEFTYSVEWSETQIPFEQRFSKYLDDSFF